ncbi:MAG: hypothetical protein K2L14_01900, partial [Duncaniella sp.]|nr:hypothetical protein [Duncaniella sp.]
EGSSLLASFDQWRIMRVKLWSETSGSTTPLYLAGKSSYFLDRFRWYGALRPMSPAEVFDYPPEMDNLLANPILARPRPDYKTVRGTVTGRPKPQNIPLDSQSSLPENEFVESAPVTGTLPDPELSTHDDDEPEEEVIENE